MGKAADRLAELLEQRERELEELHAQINEKGEAERNIWTMHAKLPEEQSLPVPRLEILVEDSDESMYDRKLTYRLVYRHFLGYCVGVPFGMTRQGGGNADRPLLELMPFRDGAHIKHDARQFGLPMFMVRGDESAEIIPE